MFHFGEFFRKPEACCQTVLPDRSVVTGQKLVENAKIKKIKSDIKDKGKVKAFNAVLASY